jgi:hypothetical protein
MRRSIGFFFVSCLILISSAFAGTSSQKIGTLAIDGRGEMDLSVVVNTDATGRADAKQIRAFGNLMGHAINQTYWEGDLDDMKKNGRPRTLLRHMGVDVLTFLTLKDFTLRDGGTIRVGYQTSPTTRRSSDVEARYDETRNEWFLGYREQPGAALTRVVRLDVTVKSIPVIGPVGLTRIVATDFFGRKFDIRQD